MQSSPLISVVIPVSDREESWRALILDLTPISDLIEIIIGAPHPSLKSAEYATLATQHGLNLRLVETELNRATQMNGAARQALAGYLWFLHADSRLSVQALQSAIEVARQGLTGLYYFDLTYQADGPRLTKLNALGAYIRSRFLGLPFGDQGFLMSRDSFDLLGKFPEDCEYGEDHLFVWKAKKAGLRVLPAGASLTTSARRYRDHGWLKTTLRHAKLFSIQVLHELIPSLKIRGGKCEHVR